MRAISAIPRGVNENGGRIVDTFILANSTPGTLPTTGEDVDGLKPDYTFAPFSILFALPSTVFIADEDGVFQAT